MNQEEIIKSLVDKTRQELASPVRPIQRSRVWQSPNAFKHLVQWSNAVLLRYLIRLYTSSLPKAEYRRKAQTDDAARSVVRNLEEGFKRANTSTYLEFVGFSQGSLEEVKGDIRELTEDGFLVSKPGSTLASIGINLKDLNIALKPRIKGNLEETKGGYQINSQAHNQPLNSYTSSTLQKPNPESDKSFLYTPLTSLYPPLSKVKAESLTYEIFVELINKTDYLLRALVSSLEKKLRDEKKGYQIEQARIKEKF